MSDAPRTAEPDSAPALIDAATVDATPIDFDDTADPGQRLVEAIRHTLASNADAARAAGQQAYLKSTLPCYGVPVPVVRRLVTGLVNEAPRLDNAQWRETVLGLWRTASFREERYAALAIARHRQYHTVANRVASLEVYEELVRTGAWWDLVDEISHLVGDVLATHRDAVTPIIRDWARDPDLWIRRCAVICQLDHRELTDTDLLVDCIESNLDDRDFFIRKSIGWALRQYARVDPEWVRSVVVMLDERLSPLSRREAMKNLT